MFHRFSTWWRALSVVLLSLATVTWPSAAQAVTPPVFTVLHQDAVATLNPADTGSVSISLALADRTHSVARILLYPRIIDRGQLTPLIDNSPDTGGAVGSTGAFALRCGQGLTATFRLGIAAGPAATDGHCGAASVRLRLPCAAAACGGVYPLRIIVSADGRTRSEWSMVAVQLARVTTPLHVDVIATIGPSAWRSATSTVAALDTVASFPNLPVTLALDYQPLASVASATNHLATTWRTALQRALASPLHRAIVATPSNVDLAGLGEHGFASAVGSQLSLTSALLRELTGRYTDASVFVAGQASVPALAALVKAGVRDVVVPDRSVNPAPSTTLTWGAPFYVADVGHVTALATDSPLAELAGDVGIEPGRRAAMTLATLSFLHFEAPGDAQPRSVVLVVPLARSGATYLRAVLHGLRTNPFASDATLSPSFTATLVGSNASPSQRTLNPPPASAWSPINVSSLEVLLNQTRSYAHGVQSTPERATLLAAANQAATLGTADRRQSAIAQASASLAAQTSQFRIDDSTITLTGTGTELPITIFKTTHYPMKVVVHLLTTTATFPKGSTMELVLHAPTTSLRVPISHLVGTELTLQVAVTTPDSTLVIARSAIQVRIAGTSVVGYVLSLLSLLVLAAWWLRTYRRSSRGRHAR